MRSASLSLQLVLQHARSQQAAAASASAAAAAELASAAIPHIYRRDEHRSSRSSPHSPSLPLYPALLPSDLDPSTSHTPAGPNPSPSSIQPLRDQQHRSSSSHFPSLSCSPFHHTPTLLLVTPHSTHLRATHHRPHQQQHWRSASSWAFWKRASQLPTIPVPEDPLPPPSAFPLSETSREAIIAITQALDAGDKACMAAAKSDAWLNVSWAMEIFQKAHNMGLPWWAAIAVVNIITRLLMAPLIIVSQKATSKLVETNYNMLHAHRLQAALTNAKTQEEQQRLHRALKLEIETQNAKSAGWAEGLTIPGVMFANTFVFLTVFSATSGLMATKAHSLMDGGTLWFTDLTTPDPYWGLPILCCLTTLALVEYGISMTGDQAPTMMKKQAVALKWFMRGMSFMFLPAASYVSAGTQLLWVSNSLFAVAQGVLLRNDKFRVRVGLVTLAHQRRMSEQIAEVTRAREPAAGADGVVGLDVPQDPVTGRAVLLKEDPKRKGALAGRGGKGAGAGAVGARAAVSGRR